MAKYKKDVRVIKRELICLTKAVNSISKNKEPDMKYLFGILYTYIYIYIYLGDFDEDEAKYGKKYEEEEENVYDIEGVKNKIVKLRSKMCDFYAEKYSNECNIQ